jgi:hypothetical protein
MAKIIESNPRRLALRFSSNTLTLDKAADTATLQRKMMFWSPAYGFCQGGPVISMA